MDGPYPRFLKERVISDTGHLSNRVASNYLKKIVGKNTKYVILAHISEKNNTKELALQTAKEALENTDINILIAEQDTPSQLIEV